MSTQVSQTVLVTGAFGQVGRRCAELLLRRGHTVIAMDLPGAAADAAVAALRADSPPGQLIAAYILGPVIRPALRAVFALQRRMEHRGPYADPWTFLRAKYGPDMLVEMVSK
ncbi:NAD-dependent epimerase/dehydratase family protein [Mycobacterium kubicae]|uniref:NAD-dependent epimerase/dehydratase family protein n=1 Tax=Mycobacterium kubicae TaxID=120959 RepID=UPI003CC830FA